MQQMAVQALPRVFNLIVLPSDPPAQAYFSHPSIGPAMPAWFAGLGNGQLAFGLD